MEVLRGESRKGEANSDSLGLSVQVVTSEYNVELKSTFCASSDITSHERRSRSGDPGQKVVVCMPCALPLKMSRQSGKESERDFESRVKTLCTAAEKHKHSHLLALYIYDNCDVEDHKIKGNQRLPHSQAAHTHEILTAIATEAMRSITSGSRVKGWLRRRCTAAPTSSPVTTHTTRTLATEPNTSVG
ncbi:hypothetical protein E2C01_054480 [Portunus trituberculatus]|uniref:Uncharacterized protein n=1 Tax=Portunus trituberculatus TaxID=210409 RepID=A0A5B7GSS7_PORTR|nr:hypothetical protein [Portunus trituberculatus]